MGVEVTYDTLYKLATETFGKVKLYLEDVAFNELHLLVKRNVGSVTISNEVVTDLFL